MSERITKAELMEGICPKCHGFHTNICHQAERALADRLAEALRARSRMHDWECASAPAESDCFCGHEQARAALAAHEEARR